MDTQNLVSVMENFMGTQGAYIRLLKLSERESIPADTRFTLAFKLMEKAMGDNNLE